ncbi:MAG: ribonuclease Z [Bacteroidia bacterium]|nr:ribonuclease Z [Bacteroidia bacterium]
MNPELHIIGTGSATPARERHPSAQVLKIGSSKILIDCGEGTQLQLLKLGIRHTGLDFICISHLHGDHYFGLIGLLSTMSLMGRTQSITLIGPPELKEILELQIKVGNMHLNYEIIHLKTDGIHAQDILTTDEFKISCFPLKHRIHCTGFRIEETPSQRHLNIDAVKLYDIPINHYKAIKAGADYLSPSGERIDNAILTSDPAPSRAFAYCSDTIFDPSIVPFIEGVDILYHESTYTKDLIDRANLYFHSTAEQAATIAQLAGVGLLIIGHFSSRYDSDSLQLLLDEARTQFPNTELAIEGRVFLV